MLTVCRKDLAFTEIANYVKVKTRKMVYYPQYYTQNNANAHLHIEDNSSLENWNIPMEQRNVEQRNVIRLHDSRFGRHFGVYKTLARVRKALLSHLPDRCSRKNQCLWFMCLQQRSKKTRTRGKLKQYMSEKLWEIILINTSWIVSMATSWNCPKWYPNHETLI